MAWLYGLLFVAFVKVVLGTVPSGFILDVAPDCKTVAGGSAEVTVTSDLSASVSVLCAQGSVLPVAVESNKVQYKATVDYSSSGTCPFKYDSKEGVKSYTVTVVVAWGVPNSQLLSSEERWQVTCTFDANGKATANAKTVDSALLSPAEIQRNKGSPTTDTINLNVCNVLGNPITAGSIPMGRMVQLQGYTNVAPGLRVSSCDAVGTQDSKTVHILKGGCGDGRIFKVNEGFTTSGKVVQSPYFPFFKIDGNTGVQFVCNFTTCTTGTCDGTSCQVRAGRRKRSDRTHDLAPQGMPAQAASTPFHALEIETEIDSVLPMLHQKKQQRGVLQSARVGVLQSARRGILKNESTLRKLLHVPMIMGVVVTISIVALLLSLYACVKRDLKGWKRSAKA